MEQMIIPKGCEITGEVRGLAYPGDIEIQEPMAVKTLTSAEGGIAVRVGDNDLVLETVTAGKDIRIEAGAVSVSILRADSLQLEVGSLAVNSEARAVLELNVTSRGPVGFHEAICEEGDLTVEATRLDAVKIHGGEVTLSMESGRLAEIKGHKVVISGDLECDRISAVETVQVISGKIRIRHVESPSFKADPSVTGIVMVATCEEVRAEGVRGFLHPNELDMLSGSEPTAPPASDPHPTRDLGTVPTETEPADEREETVVELTSADLDEPGDTGPEYDEVEDTSPDEDDTPSDLETVAAEEIDSLPEVEELDEGPNFAVVEDPVAQAAHVEIDEPTEYHGTDEPTSQTQQTAGIEAEAPGNTDPEPIQVNTDDFTNMETALEAPVEEVEEIEEIEAEDLTDPLDAELTDPDAEEPLTDELEPVDTTLEEIDSALPQELGEVLEDEVEELGENDLAEPLEDSDLLETVNEENDENREAVLVDKLGGVLDRIRAYFPEDNYPQSIDQIRGYVANGQLNLFRRARNRESVIKNFEKFQHPEIDALVSEFFSILDTYFEVA